MGGPLSGTVSGLLSLILTVLLFLLVYRYLPLAPVLWRDATFGAILAVILFESMKYLFFWVGSIAIERSILYGPLSSAVILLVWAYLAGFIFLFAATLVSVSSQLRPGLTTKLDESRDTRPHEAT